MSSPGIPNRAITAYTSRGWHFLGALSVSYLCPEKNTLKKDREVKHCSNEQLRVKHKPL